MTPNSESVKPSSSPPPMSLRYSTSMEICPPATAGVVLVALATGLSRAVRALAAPALSTAPLPTHTSVSVSPSPAFRYMEEPSTPVHSGRMVTTSDRSG